MTLASLTSRTELRWFEYGYFALVFLNLPLQRIMGNEHIFADGVPPQSFHTFIYYKSRVMHLCFF